MERSLHRPRHLGAGDQLHGLVGALEHQSTATEVHGEHAGRASDRRRAALEDRRRFGDGHLSAEGEAQRFECRGEVFRFGIGRPFGHRGAPEDVEHEHVIHGRSP